jgi:transposase
MLVVETIGRIRREHFIKGKSIKQFVRELKVSRNTVRKVLRSGATCFEYAREVQPLPKLGPWRADLDRMLATNEAKSGRERLTLIRLFEELRALGYEGGYDAVRRYARTRRRARGAATSEAYVPLSFAPGEAYQFDWSHEIVVLNGVTTLVKVAHVRLCHSRMPFVRAYPRESQEMVFDAHDRAFAFYRGTCVRGIYDNMKTAVESVFVGKDRAFNRRFLRMCSHYLVEPTACTPGAGWEKGQVENQVGLVRERFFTPRLRAGRQGRIADRLTRLDFLILDELGYLPFAQSGGQLLFHLVSRLYEQTSIIVTTSVTGPCRSIPLSDDPVAGVSLLSGVGARPPPDGVG